MFVHDIARNEVVQYDAACLDVSFAQIGGGGCEGMEGAESSIGHDKRAEIERHYHVFKHKAVVFFPAQWAYDASTTLHEKIIVACASALIVVLYDIKAYGISF